jgi:hypothetical protein
MSEEQPEIKKERRGGFRPGAGRPKGRRNARPRAPAHSDAIECSKIERLLSDHYSGIAELSPTQLKAIEIRYSRLRPTLASIEQTFNDPRDQADASQIAAKLAALFNEKPELFEQVIALKNAAAAQQTAPAEQVPTVKH